MERTLPPRVMITKISRIFQYHTCNDYNIFLQLNTIFSPNSEEPITTTTKQVFIKELIFDGNQ